MVQSIAVVAPPQRVLLRFAPAILIIFSGYLTIALPLVVLPLQLHDQLGFGTFIVGVAVGTPSLVTLATRQFVGGLCDRIGPKPIVLLGGIGLLIASFVYLVSTIAPLGSVATLSTIFVARIVLGAGESLLMTGSLAWAISVVGPSNTGKVMVWVGIAMYGAIAAGSPLGFWLLREPVVGAMFGGVAAGAIVCSLLAALICLTITPVVPHGGEQPRFARVVARIAPFGAGLTLATLGFGSIAGFIALDFQAKGWPGAGFALTGFGAAYIVTRIMFGHWPDRFGGARVAFWSLVVETCGQFLLWVAPIPSIALAGTVMTGAGFSLVFPSFGVEAVKQVPPTNRGSALGAYVAFFDLGFALAGPSTGIVAGAFGYSAVFAAGAIASIIAIAPAFWTERNRTRSSAIIGGR
jgi:MFS family permease